MTKIVVISDTHGSKKGINALTSLFEENDYIVHLGDGANDFAEIRSKYPEKAYYCAGNCDFFSSLPEEGSFEVEQVKIFYCHGHRYGVKGGLGGLAERAKAQDCDIALYGHTHRADIAKINGVMLINPGSLRRGVDEGGSYCYLVIHKKEITPVIVGAEYN